MSASQVQANAMTCPLNQVPRYAYLLSAGAQPAYAGSTSSVLGNRTVHAVYDFATDNTANKGGTISTTNGLCWDAGAGPVVGSFVTLQTCGPLDTPAQTWFFRPDLSLQWQGDVAQNLCLDYRGVAELPRDSMMTLQTCLGNGVAGTAYDSLAQAYSPPGKRYQQYTLHAWLKDVAANGDFGNSNCIVSYTPATGLFEQRLVNDRLAMLPTCSNNSQVSLGRTTGAGGTGGVTNGLPSISEQLVNYLNTQSCLDVAGSNPSNGLIQFPCHQAPDPTKVEGNQRFTYTGTTTTPGALSTIRTDGSPATQYPRACMQSNGTTVVTLVSCVDGLISQQWLMTGYQAGDYAGSYLIKDYTGKCLTGVGTYGIQLLPCDGRDAQKWNAPPGGTQSQLEGVGET